MKKINTDFDSFQKAFIDEIQAEGGKIEIAPNGDFKVMVSVLGFPSGQMLWEQGNLHQKYNDFLQYLKQQGDIQLTLLSQTERSF